MSTLEASLLSSPEPESQPAGALRAADAPLCRTLRRTAPLAGGGARAGEPDRRAHRLQRRLRLPDGHRRHTVIAARRAGRDGRLRVSAPRWTASVESARSRPLARASPLGQLRPRRHRQVPAPRHAAARARRAHHSTSRWAAGCRAARRWRSRPPRCSRRPGARARPHAEGAALPEGRARVRRRAVRHHGPVASAPRRGGCALLIDCRRRDGAAVPLPTRRGHRHHQHGRAARAGRRRLRPPPRRVHRGRARPGRREPALRQPRASKRCRGGSIPSSTGGPVTWSARTRARWPWPRPWRGDFAAGGASCTRATARCATTTR